MRRLGLAVLVLAVGVSLPASAAGWERENGWWMRLLSWWTIQAAPALELEREVTADGYHVDPDGRPRTVAGSDSSTAEGDDGVHADPDGR